MNGIELSRSYFEEYGRPMLEEAFSDVLPYLAVGIFGAGSECFGYDDAVSRDHDFEPGFCIMLPDESVVNRRTAFLLERAYARLPGEYLGVRRERLAPAGGARRGVLRTEAFFLDHTGCPDGCLTTEQWITAPEQGLAEATNGCLFFDRYGEVTEIRNRLACYPEEIRLKKLAGQLLLMAQSGQYNYSRCLDHGDPAAAQLAANAYVESIMSAVFLLNRRYRPFYKWRFRAFRELPLMGTEAEALEELICTGNDAAAAGKKKTIIQKTANEVIRVLHEQGLISSETEDLERLAYEVNDRIADGVLRNMHILAAV